MICNKTQEIVWLEARNRLKALALWALIYTSSRHFLAFFLVMSLSLSWKASIMPEVCAVPTSEIRFYSVELLIVLRPILPLADLQGY